MLLLQAPASAGHGSWHHNYHVYDPSPSQYRAYAHTKSSQPTDLLYANLYVTRNGSVVINETAGCGPIDEGCSNVTTSPRSWAQGGSHMVRSKHCGRDGNHHMNIGTNCYYGAGTGTHLHVANWSD